MELSFPIVEIFDSLQGEGVRVGTACRFVRFAGCNMKPPCSFCDTDYKEREQVEIDELVKRMEGAPGKNIVITGGEPTIHKELFKFVWRLRQSDYFVALETNGANKVEFNVDWLTVSPKNGLFRQQYGDEMKVLWMRGIDSTKEAFLHYLRRCSNFTHYFVQPIERKGKFEKIDEIIEFIKENSVWRLSIQLHKVLGIR